MSAYLLGVDVGTSACKAAAFDENGAVIAASLREYSVSYPKAGYAEQSPDEWQNAVFAAIREICEKLGDSSGKIAAVGVDGQSWSAIAVDKSGSVLAPTPIWTDTRAIRECEEIKQAIPEDELFSLCGNPTSPSYTLPKILWYKNNAPSVYKNADKILQSNSFIVYRLCGRLTQDLSQGYGLCCFDMEKGEWNESAAERLGIRPSLLPELFPSHKIVGQVSRQAAELTGLKEGTPVAAGGLDAACGALGAGVVKAGQTQEQGGQAGGMSICMDKCLADKRLILGRHVVPNKWLLQGGTTGGGGALKWLRETICPELSFESMSELAAEVPAGSEGVVFLPYLAGERSPIWNPDACGVFYGLRYSKSRAHMIRSVMESVAYTLRHNLEAAAEAGASTETLRAMGGSANSRVWTQIKADVTGRAIEVPMSDTATTRGAAILAGVGAGVYGGFEEAAEKTVKVKRVHTPSDENAEAYERGYKTFREIYERLEPLMRGNKE